jgi:riboflavin synthase
VNWVSAGEFGVNLIPHTQLVTTLCDLEDGSKVNLEIDMLARYVEQILSSKLTTDAG